MKLVYKSIRFKYNLPNEFLTPLANKYSTDQVRFRICQNAMFPNVVFDESSLGCYHAEYARLHSIQLCN